MTLSQMALNQVTIYRPFDQKNSTYLQPPVRSGANGPKHARTNDLGVADPTERLVFSLLMFQGVAVVNLGSNVLPTPSVAVPLENQLRIN